MKVEWVALVIAAFALLVGGASAYLGWEARGQADEALEISEDALEVAKTTVEVRGTSLATASLVRNVHEISNGTDIIWEWFSDSELTIDVTFTNLTKGPVSVSRVIVNNAQGEEIYRKDFRGDERVRVVERGNAPVPIVGDEIQLAQLNELLVGESCNRIRGDECQRQQELIVTGRVVVTPIGGKEASSDFELVIRHEPVRSCAQAGVSAFTEPTEGCPPEVIPTPPATQPTQDPTG